jgi:peptidoglycan LD-endopeptidase CwlK
MSKAIVTMVSLLLLACTQAQACGGLEAKAQRYIKAYPDFFTSYADGCLVTRDGIRIPFDDGRKKDLDALVRNKEAGDEAFDPEDALYWHYPAGSALPAPSSPPRGDPGRIRPGAVFRSMYGSTPEERAKKMRSITWFGSRNDKPRMVRVTTANGVDKALERVAREIEALPENRKRELEGIAMGTDGPYGQFERPVRGFPGRTSGHAYGIAIDINGNLAYFWESRKDEPYSYRNNVPAFLVDIFERNGFIWGGRWHSYDAMHFEYRPELLAK